jgi:uncharacterized protein YcbK (DUF882 family)
MIEDKQLTDHFSLYELTATTLETFQERNRDVTEEQIEKLRSVARLLDHVRFILEVPIIVHSGYRCIDLNRAIGSKDTSQHLLCEAADFVPRGLDLAESFRKLWRDMKENGTNVGQLIYESTFRPYGKTSWIHISLGTPYRDQSLCRQVLRMENGKYTLLA